MFFGVWVIRTLAEIAEADRQARSRRWALALSAVGIVIVGSVLSHEITGPRRWVASMLMAVVIGGTLFLITQRKKPTGVLCKDCERMYAPSPRKLCPCGGRLFDARELKWVAPSALRREEAASDAD